MKKHNRKHRGGIALILVVMLMAAAAIMGFALLSSASMQAQASRNASSSFIADDLAQSGTNLSTYYLMYPDKANSTQMTTTGNTTFWNPGTNVSSLSLGNGAAVSKVDVTLASRTSQQVNYTVDVTANSGSNAGTVTRTSRSTVQVAQRYLPKYAFAANDSFTIPLTFVTSSINGSTRVDGGLGGLLSAVTGLLFGTTTNPTPSYPTVAVPVYNKINLASSVSHGTYAYNGVSTYTPFTFNSGSTSLGTTSFSSPGSNNPGKVFYIPGNVTLGGTGSYTINGTVILATGANLTLANTVTITPVAGYPGLIVGKDVVFSGAGRTLKVNGLMWMGGNITGTGVLPSGTLNVNGALMMGGSNPKIDTSKLLPTSKLTVAYPTSASTLDSAVPDVLYVPEFSDMDQTPKSIRIVQ